jgi:hypothetical protein
MSGPRALKLLFGLTALVATTLQAGVLTSHSLVSARADTNRDRPERTIESDGPSDTSLLHDSDSAGGAVVLAAEARAYTGLEANGFLHAAASAYNDFQGAEARGFASAAWRDVAFADAAFAGPYITLYFDVDANFGDFGPNRSAALSINGSTNVENNFGAGWEQLGSVQLFGPGYDATEPRSEFTTIDGFDSATYENSFFHGTFHIVVPKNDALNGFGWGVSMTLHADAFSDPENGGATSASVLALNSMGLTRVTDPNGNSIPVTFESGLTLATVPEPATIWMFLGFFAIYCCRGLRCGALHLGCRSSI